MGKRSDFVRNPRDFYVTPRAAVEPLIPHLPEFFTFCEPCAGDLRLALHLDYLTDSNCIMTAAYDLEPQDDGVEQLDATTLERHHIGANCDYIITNPPWDRTKKSGYLLHRMIERFSDLCPTWLLFDADWLHTIQAQPFIRDRLLTVVSVGRVKWIEDSKMTGKDNCAWYLFDKDARKHLDYPQFFGRGIFPACPILKS